MTTVTLGGMSTAESTETAEAVEESPRLSVIIPVNDDPRLGACLASLAGQTLERSAFEIIVVGEGSSDATRRLVSDVGGRHAFHAGGAYAARAAGARLARGRVLAFTDADTILSPEWLAVIDLAFRDEACLAVTGPSSSASSTRVASWVQSVDEDRWERLRAQPDHAVVETRNFAIRREVLERVPFDPAFRQAGDLDIGIRLRKAGVRIQVLEALRLTHQHPESLVGLVRRGIRRGRGLARLDRKHGPGRHAQGERPLSIAGLDVKAALLGMSRLPGWRWLVAGGAAAGIVGALPVTALLARLPGRAADAIGERTFVVLERSSLLLGRALGPPRGIMAA